MDHIKDAAKAREWAEHVWLNHNIYDPLHWNILEQCGSYYRFGARSRQTKLTYPAEIGMAALRQKLGLTWGKRNGSRKGKLHHSGS